MTTAATRPWPIRPTTLAPDWQVLTQPLAEHTLVTVLSTLGVDPNTPTPWHERERLRCRWIYPPWPTHLSQVMAWVQHLPAHLYAFPGGNADPTMIYFTPDERHGREDRKVKMRIARFFRHYLPTIPHEQAARLSNQLTAWFREVEPLHITHDPDEIEWVYRNGPRSCMSRTASTYHNGVHPTRCYARPPLGVAYLLNPYQRNRVMARTVVNVDNRRYVRIFGNDSMMLRALAQHGFETSRSDPVGTFHGAWLRTTALSAPPEGPFNLAGNRRFSHPYLDTHCGTQNTYAVQSQAGAPIELLVWHESLSALRTWLKRYPDGRYSETQFNGYRAGSCTVEEVNLCAHCGDLFPHNGYGIPRKVRYQAHSDIPPLFLCPRCDAERETLLPDTVVHLDRLTETVKYPQRFTVAVYTEDAYTPSHRATQSSWSFASRSLYPTMWQISPDSTYPGIIRSTLLVRYQNTHYHPHQMGVCRLTQHTVPQKQLIDGVALGDVLKQRLFHLPLYVSCKRLLVQPKSGVFLMLPVRRLRFATHPHGVYRIPLYRYLLACLDQPSVERHFNESEWLRFEFYNGAQLVVSLTAAELIEYCTAALRHALPELAFDFATFPRAVVRSPIPYCVLHDYAHHLTTAPRLAA